MSSQKTPQQILSEVEQSNDVDTRIRRRNLLNSMRARVDQWIHALDKRDMGPSGKEMARIASDLEGHMQQIRSHSCK